MQRQPAAGDGEIKPGLVFGRASLVLEQKRPIDQFDVNACTASTELATSTSL
jgi:hypothetical protein